MRNVKMLIIGSVMVLGMNIGGCSSEKVANNLVEVKFETAYDNVHIMKTDCKNKGDYKIVFKSNTGRVTETKYEKLDGERITVPIDTVDIKVYKM